MGNIKNAGKMVKYVKGTMDGDSAVIDVALRDGYDLYEPLSPDGDRELNPDIYGYIEDKANIIPGSIPLKIRFHGRRVAPEEQESVREIMRKHYEMRSYDKTWDSISAARIMIVLTAIGAAVIALYLYLSLSRNDSLMLELLSVVGTFALWEAANRFLLERPAIKREYRDIMQFRNAEIEFSEE